MTTSALRLTAQLFQHISEDAGEELLNDIYVDDVTTGADNKLDEERLKTKMEHIAENGGFKFKEWTFSGDKKHLDILDAKDFLKVLGCF